MKIDCQLDMKKILVKLILYDSFFTRDEELFVFVFVYVFVFVVRDQADASILGKMALGQK
jgi:hypothetical protein